MSSPEKMDRRHPEIVRHASPDRRKKCNRETKPSCVKWSEGMSSHKHVDSWNLTRSKSNAENYGFIAIFLLRFSCCFAAFS